MNARPVLHEVAAALRKCGLEAILIGNAAAALHGAPVTTIDVDFLFRKTPTNVRKLKVLAATLGAICFKPFYPVSGLVRISRDEDSLQLDFMPAIHGVRSFNSLRSRATRFELGGDHLLVASLSDIIKSKRAAGRPRDHAVLDVLELTLRRQETRANSTKGSGGLEEGK